MSDLPSGTDRVSNGSVDLFVEVSAALNPVDSGGAAPVLLLSEAEAPSSRWPTALIDGLTTLGSAVIRFDTRDVGRSSWVEEPYGMGDLVGDAIAVLDHFEVESAHVIGRSMGGIVAQHLALDAPERLESVSLISTTPGRREDFGLPEPWLIDRMSARLFEEPPVGIVARVEWVIDQLEWFSGPLFDFDRTQAARAVFSEVTEMWRGQNGHGLAVVEAPDRFDELASISVPSMVVHGTADPVYPVEHGQALASQLAGSQLHLIEGLGHELPDRFLPALIELFARFRESAR